ncbi:hypothetical protein ACJMK2_006794 [Sinanodonta woodiana]|uniref:Uncharacterized protein n=1 Tax=Sinanodonta woodiana TaxID=1069815 RepID=A0ABD3VU90_SINWO
MVSRNTLSLCVLLCSIIVIKGQFNPFDFVFGGPFRPPNNEFQRIFDNVFNSIQNAPVSTYDLTPGERRVINEGNTRGIAFRSPDGQSSGFSFTTGSGGGNGGGFVATSDGSRPAGGMVFSRQGRPTEVFTTGQHGGSFTNDFNQFLHHFF